MGAFGFFSEQRGSLSFRAKEMGGESYDSPPMYLVRAVKPYFFFAAGFFAAGFFAAAGFAAAFFFGAAFFAGAAAFLAGAAFFAGAFLAAILGHPLSSAVGGG